MGALFLFLICGVIVWFFASLYPMAKEILKALSYAIFLFASCFFIFSLIKNNFNFNISYNPTYWYLLAIPFLLFCLYIMSKISKRKPLSIIANQQRYFKEVDSNMIYNFFSNRRIVKKDRIEIDVNREEKTLFKNFILESEKIELISTHFFARLKQIPQELNIIKDVSDIKSKLHLTIFNKLKSIIEDKEIDIDFNLILKNNNYCLEYFLMELWEDYTGDINIGTSNLIVIAQSDIERDLIGAINILDLSCVLKNGSALYYLYIKFKNRLDNYEVKNDALNNVFQEDEYL